MSEEMKERIKQYMSDKENERNNIDKKREKEKEWMQNYTEEKE